MTERSIHHLLHYFLRFIDPVAELAQIEFHSRQHSRRRIDRLSCRIQELHRRGAENILSTKDRLVVTHVHVWTKSHLDTFLMIGNGHIHRNLAFHQFVFQVDVRIYATENMSIKSYLVMLIDNILEYGHTWAVSVSIVSREYLIHFIRDSRCLKQLE